MLPGVLVSLTTAAPDRVELAGTPHVDHSVVEVDVGPSNRSSLAGAEPEVQHGEPHCLEVSPASGAEERLGFGDRHRSAALGWRGVRRQLDEGRDVAGDDLPTLCPSEGLVQGGAELHQGSTGERPSWDPAASRWFRGRALEPVGAAGERRFDVIGREGAQPASSQILGKDAGGPAVAGHPGGGKVPVGERLGFPHPEQIAQGNVAGREWESVVGGLPKCVQAAARLGLRRGQHLATLAVDDDPADPSTLGRVEVEGSFATASPGLVSCDLPALP